MDIAVILAQTVESLRQKLQQLPPIGGDASSSYRAYVIHIYYYFLLLPKMKLSLNEISNYVCMP